MYIFVCSLICNRGFAKIHFLLLNLNVMTSFHLYIVKQQMYKFMCSLNCIRDLTKIHILSQKLKILRNNNTFPYRVSPTLPPPPPQKLKTNVNEENENCLNCLARSPSIQSGIFSPRLRERRVS